MKIYKKFIISFVSAIFTVIVVFGGYTIYAQVDVSEYITFQNPTGNFADVQSDYHQAMNNYFNDKFEALVEILEEPNFNEVKDFNPPEGSELCENTNVSTYCISMGALDLYITYVETLNNMKRFLPRGEVPADAGAIELLNRSAERNLEIEREMEDARKVMEATANVYDEFRLAYPMHLKYQNIINNLIKYKISLSKIKDQVERFPLKFIDSTSSQCK